MALHLQFYSRIYVDSVNIQPHTIKREVCYNITNIMVNNKAAQSIKSAPWLLRFQICIAADLWCNFIAILMSKSTHIVIYYIYICIP